MKPTQLTVAMIAAAFVLPVVLTERSAGQVLSSLTEQEIEVSETRTALEALLRDNAELRKKLAVSEASVTALQKNLAASSGEAEVLKRKISELMLRFEALGLDAAADTGRIEQRLLKAVNDLRLAETDREALRQALIELCEAALRWQNLTPGVDAEARNEIEATIRRASKALGGTPAQVADAEPAKATLTDAMVIAIKEDLALVVVNVGRMHGVKVGMPFRVIQSNAEVGSVRVVDVRDKIAGAVIQDLNSDTVKVQVGDRLKVGAGH